MAKLFIALLLPLALSGQIKTEKFFCDENMLPCDSLLAHFIKYHIFTDTTTNSGIIKITKPDGQITSEEEYSDLVKKKSNGFSKTYHENGKIKISSYYKDDKLHGEFTTYYSTGGLRRKEVYENGKMLLSNCYTSTGDDTTYFDFEIMPKYPGGEGNLMKFLSENIKYPKDAIKDGFKGRVYLTFIIDKNGEVKNERILRGVHPLLDEEALRVLRLMQNWEPGLQDGEKISVYYNIPINFNLY